MRALTLLAVTAQAALAFADHTPPVRVATTVGYRPGFLDDMARSPDGLLAAVGGSYEADALSHPGTDVFIRTSNDAGLSWQERGNLVETGSESLGRPLIAAPAGGVLDVVWAAAEGSLIRYLHKRSTDGGLTWSSLHELPLRTARIPPRDYYLPHAPGGLSTAADGRIALALVGGGADGVVVAASEDGGAKWKTSVVSPRAAGAEPAPPRAYWTLSATLLVAWSESSGPSGSRGARVMLRRSGDGGGTFGPPAVLVSASGADRESVSLGHVVERLAGELALTFHAVAPSVDESRLVRSNDEGANWTTPIAIAPGGTLDLDSDLAGSIWLLAGGIYHSRDGVQWSSEATPAGCERWVDQLVALGGDAALLGRTLPSLTWRTADRGATWDSPVTAFPFRRPVEDTALVRAAGGRLLGVWVEGTGLDVTVRASVSDDEGITWSAPVRIDDARVSLAANRLERPLRFRSYPETDSLMRKVEVTATGAGGFAVLWLAREADCAEIRVSVSPDGTTWERSRTVAAAGSSGSWAPSLSLVDDGAGRLVVAWLAASPGGGGSYASSRSLDGGVTWSPPSFESWGPAQWSERTSNVTRFESGVLGFLRYEQDLFGLIDLMAYRSDNGGVSWDSVPVWRLSAGLFDYSPIQLDMVVAGPRIYSTLFAEIFDSMGSGSLGSVTFESWDGGLNWTRLANVYSYQDLPLVGDGSGNVFVPLYPWLSLTVNTMREVVPGGRVLELGSIPVATARRGGWAFAEEEIGIFYADSEFTSPPGVFFTRTLPPPLRRDDSIRSFTPAPDLRAIFPLAPWLGVSAVAGMTDPDATVLGDASRPLVLYQREKASGNGLRLTRAGSLIRLDW